MKKSGILLHISSLPSPFGIGTLGKEAYMFVDFLKEAKQSLWQILPIGPAGHETSGNSPYSPFSVFAFNTNFIDFDMLKEEGLLSKDDCNAIKWSKSKDRVDYELIHKNRREVLYKAYMNFNVSDVVYKNFCTENSYWLNDYALFAAIKEDSGGIQWNKWTYKLRIAKKQAIESFCQKNQESVEFEKVLQFLFYAQWKKLKEYCKECGVSIIGDMPIYTAYDSCDVWATPKMFQLNKNLTPKFVAGVPPDSFTAEGQLWGNPLYDWDYLEKNGYDWWGKRIRQSAQLFDIIRIDHFRGFESFYKIPYGDKNAVNGFWEKGPGIKLFNNTAHYTGSLKIIAEDLGYLDENVKDLLKATGFPGMKVLQFAFDNDLNNVYLPHNYGNNNVVYTGTHDNNTTKGWYKTLDKKQKGFVKQYLKISLFNKPVYKMIEAALASSADYVVIPMQDYLNLNSDARMNTPSTTNLNWKWRLKKGHISSALTKKIKMLTLKHNRNV